LSGGEQSGSEARRAGTVALVGRPNAGKSTLMNRYLGEKVAIVSNKPQTTRHRLVGILSDERGQMVFYDTPGIHRPLHRLNRRMMQHAIDALGDSDVICLLVDASQSFGSGDAWVVERLERTDGPRVLALNKVDRVRKPELLPVIDRYAATGLFEEIVPISALDGDNCPALLEALWTRLPEGEALYDPELFTIHPERFLATELIREKVLRQTRAELPFVTAVVIDAWEEVEERSLTRIFASILVERPGQKRILIGRGGETIKSLGVAARRDLEDLLGRKVPLELHVRHKPRWRENRRLLADLDRDLSPRF
jgi:GTP-binding protein Era